MFSPLASDIKATKMPTTNAIVPMVINVFTRLTTRLRRLYFRGIAIEVLRSAFTKPELEFTKLQEVPPLLLSARLLFLSWPRSRLGSRRSQVQSTRRRPAQEQ